MLRPARRAWRTHTRRNVMNRRASLLSLLAALVVFGSSCSENRSADPLAPADAASDVSALADGPQLVDPNLSVRTVIGGLNQPVGLVFLGNNDILVTEKATGRVQRIVNGALHSTVLDLAVNSNSERGLLGIALDPNFPSDPAVYL